MSNDKNNPNQTGNQQQGQNSGGGNPFDIHLETSSLKEKPEIKNGKK